MEPLTKPQFQLFLETMPDTIQSAKKLLKKEILEYSFSEVDTFEKWYKKFWKKPSKIGLSKNELDTIFVAYIGTAVLWHFGGYWLYVNNHKSPDLGTPFIADSLGSEAGSSPAFSPEDWRYFIDTKQDDERISSMFKRWQHYVNNSPEIVLKPIRNIY